MGSCGGGNSQSTTDFRRVGSTQTDRSRAVPAWLQTAMMNNIQSSSVSPSLGANEDTFLSNLLTQNNNLPANANYVNPTIQQDPLTFTGSVPLTSIASTDPMSSTYAEQLSSFFDDAFSQAAAAGSTGPEAVRGGAAHGAMVKGQVLEKAALDKFREITNLQLQQQDRTMSAAQISNAIEQARRGGILSGQNQLMGQVIEGQRNSSRGAELLNMKRRVGADAATSLSDMIAPTKMLTADNLFGSGTQESSQFGWNAGLNCCFIFLEVLNGTLPWYVRYGRDLFCEEDRVRGYKRMAKWLVPQMQRYGWVKKLVNAVMVKPFLLHGAWFFNADGARPIIGRITMPICVSWFKVWDFLGKRK